MKNTNQRKSFWKKFKFDRDYRKKFSKDFNLSFLFCIAIWVIACLLFSKPINALIGKIGATIFSHDSLSVSIYRWTITSSLFIYLILRLLFFKRILWGQFPFFKIGIFIAVWHFSNFFVEVKPGIRVEPISDSSSLNFLWLFYCFCLVDFLCMVIYYSIKVVPRSDTESSFITDIAFDPKDKDQTEKLGFENFAKRIAEEIKTVSSKESVVFGINGEWGEGKTSMINLIRQQLEDEKYTVVDFHPWKTNSGKAMNQLFFDALKDGLKNKIWGINWQIDRYADALLQLDKTGIGKVIWQFISQPDSVEKQKQKLAESMKLLDNNLVVVVDDLDRLAKNEIADVLKLMRDTANFPNLVFLAAYDRAYLDEAIKSEINPHNYKNYMDKIVLWEAPIYRPQPRTYVDVLQGYFNDGFKNYANEIDALFLVKYDRQIILPGSSSISNTPTLFYEVLNDCFRNLREVKRFYNAFSFEFRHIENKGVDFHDFFCLALMKFKSKEYYIQFKNVFHQLNHPTEKATKIVSDPHKYINKIEKKDEKYLENILIKLIQYNSSSQGNSGSFGFYKNWPLYFHLGNNDNLTTSELALLLNEYTFEEFKFNVINYFEVIKRFGEYEVLEMISNSNNPNVENYKRLIWLSIQFDDQSFYQKTITYLRISDPEEMSHGSELIDFINTEDIKEKAKKIIGLMVENRKEEINKGLYHPSFPQPNKQEEFCIDTISAISFFQNEFKEFVGSEKGISIKVIKLYYFSYQNVNNEMRIENDQGIIQLMREKANKYPDEFIKFLIVEYIHFSPSDEIEFTFCDFLLLIFKDKNDLLDYLKPENYAKEKKKAKIFYEYAKETVSEKMQAEKFKVPYRERADTFDDLNEYDDFVSLFKK
jgi:hypothetical protein